MSVTYNSKSSSSKMPQLFRQIQTSTEHGKQVVSLALLNLIQPVASALSQQWGEDVQDVIDWHPLSIKAATDLEESQVVRAQGIPEGVLASEIGIDLTNVE